MLRIQFFKQREKIEKEARMPEVSVESVDRDLREVTLRVQSIYLVFQKSNSGRMMCVSKYTFGGGNVFYVPKVLYVKAIKRAAAILK